MMPNLQVQFFLDCPLPNADVNKNGKKLLGCDLHCGQWFTIILNLKALAGPSARHNEPVSIAVGIFPNGYEGSTNLPAAWHSDPINP